MVRAISKKICLLGDFAVGKTSLVRRFVYDRFNDAYLSTIGVKVSRKTVTLAQPGGPVEVTMMLWDVAGSNEFRQVRASYLRGTAGAVLVCDLTRPETLDHLHSYLGDLERISPGAHLILAANKRDLVEPPPPGGAPHLTLAQAEAAASDLGIPCTLTSAKTGEAVEDLFRALAHRLLPAP